MRLLLHCPGFYKGHLRSSVVLEAAAKVDSVSYIETVLHSEYC